MIDTLRPDLATVSQVQSETQIFDHPSSQMTQHFLAGRNISYSANFTISRRPRDTDCF